MNTSLAQNVALPKWTCPLCMKTFDNRTSYWKHKNTMVTPCITKQQVDDLYQNYDALRATCAKLQNELEAERSLLVEYKNIINAISTQKQILCETDLDKVQLFVMYLHEYNLFDVFKEIFQDHEVSHKLAQKFIAIAKKKRDVKGELKRDILFKQDFTCLKCSRRTKALEIDHITPLYQGGDNSPANLRGLCPTCHGEKTMHDSIDFYDNIQQTCHHLFAKKRKRGEEDEDQMLI